MLLTLSEIRSLFSFENRDKKGSDVINELHAAIFNVTCWMEKTLSWIFLCTGLVFLPLLSIPFVIWNDFKLIESLIADRFPKVKCSSS